MNVSAGGHDGNHVYAEKESWILTNTFCDFGELCVDPSGRRGKKSPTRDDVRDQFFPRESVTAARRRREGGIELARNCLHH